MSTWIIDDTGFLKQGDHSVGVQRQYTGSAGKVTNCQIGVSLSDRYARNEHVPIDFALYLPKSWTEDAGRRRGGAHPGRRGVQDQATISRSSSLPPPSKTRFRAKSCLPIAFTASPSDLRNVIRDLWLSTSALPSTQSTRVWRARPAIGRRRGEPVGAQQLGVDLGPKAFRRITWREGTRKQKKEAELSLLLPSRKGRERRWHGSAGSRSRYGSSLSGRRARTSRPSSPPHFAPPGA